MGAASVAPATPLPGRRSEGPALSSTADNDERNALPELRATTKDGPVFHSPPPECASYRSANPRTTKSLSPLVISELNDLPHPGLDDVSGEAEVFACHVCATTWKELIIGRFADRSVNSGVPGLPVFPVDNLPRLMLPRSPTNAKLPLRSDLPTRSRRPIRRCSPSSKGAIRGRDCGRRGQRTSRPACLYRPASWIQPHPKVASSDNRHKVHRHAHPSQS